MKKYIIFVLVCLLGVGVFFIYNNLHQKNITQNKLHNLEIKIRKKAQAGDVEAQIQLAKAYEEGGCFDQKHLLCFDRVKQDYKKAAYWYKKAAEQGNTEAQLDLGVMYMNGLGVDKNIDKFIEWYSKAGEQGNTIAQGVLGRYYFYGNVVDTDYKKAAYWYKKLIEQEDAANEFDLNEIGYNLGWIYYKGKGVKKDYKKAAHWYKKAAEQGNARAQLILGLMYSMGRGVEQNHKEAVNWYKKAAKQESVKAQLLLGSMYYNGEGVEQDYAKAARWCKMAAEKGNPKAQRFLGIMYYGGKGIRQNYERAAKWLTKSAEQGDVEAQYNLSLFYYEGLGVKQNYVESYKWLIIAAIGGDKKVLEARDNLSKELTNSQIMEAQRRAESFESKEEAIESRDRSTQEPADLMVRNTGTGFFITTDGFIITANHVVEDAEYVKVKTKNNIFTAKVISVDSLNDIALLKIEANPFKSFEALSLCKSSAVKLGDSVFTVGFPNLMIQGFNPKLTKGTINSLTGIQDDPRYFQVSVSVQPGNSGGALVDENGNVIGLLLARLSEEETYRLTGTLPQNVNYALRGSYILAFLESHEVIEDKLSADCGEKNTKKFKDIVNKVKNSTVIILVYQ